MTIVGYPGSGKTSLAATFPKPIFIQTDDNAETVFESWEDDKKPSFMPKIPHANVKQQVRPSEVVLAQMRELASAEHGFETLILDTATSLNLLIEEEVTAFDGVENVAEASGGFHKGYKTVAAKHAKIRAAAEYLRSKGMTIVFLCHTATHKVKNSPDLPECNVYGLDMHIDSRPWYVNHSDAVLYLKQVEMTDGLETRRNKQGKEVITKSAKVKKTGGRVLITSSDGVYGFVDAKNCYAMPNKITVEHMENPILQYIPYLKDYVTFITKEEDQDDEQKEPE